MRRAIVIPIFIFSVVCSSVSCGSSSSNVQTSSSTTEQPGTSDCAANTERLPLRIYYAPKEDALDTTRLEYRGDWDDHAEQVWRLEHVATIDDTFITGTLTEGSNHLRAFDDGKQRFYRKSQWLCE